MITSFAPIEPADAKILLLGTMPSVQSLLQARYYGNPQNMFWKLIFALWDKPEPKEYQEKTAFLKEKRIALWDVLMACEREGSLDSNIKNPQPNDIIGLLERQPHIHTIFFNSQNAERFFRRLVLRDIEREYRYVTLPSSSPARVMRFDEKLSHWRAVRLALERGTV